MGGGLVVWRGVIEPLERSGQIGVAARRLVERASGAGSPDAGGSVFVGSGEDLAVRGEADG